MWITTYDERESRPALRLLDHRGAPELERWPGARRGFVFRASPHVVPTRWGEGHWTRAVEHVGAHRVTIRRAWNDDGELREIESVSSALAHCSRTSFTHDRAGRLIEVIHAHMAGECRLRYGYNRNGLLERESLLKGRDGHWTTVLHAVHNHASDGELTATRIFGRAGRCLERRSYLAEGRFSTSNMIDSRGRTWLEERAEYHPDGRLAERMTVLLGRPGLSGPPRRRWWERVDYRPLDRRPAHRIIEVEHAIGLDSRSNVVWRFEAEEELAYHPGHEEQPVWDETRYFALDGTTLTERVLVSYHFDRRGQVEGWTVLMEDLSSGEVRSRTERPAPFLIDREYGGAEAITT